MTSVEDEVSVLEADAAARFVTDASGRVLRQNDPDRSPASRFWLARSRRTSVTRFRDDLDAATVAGLSEIAAREALWDGRAVRPSGFEAFATLLAKSARLEASTTGLIYRLAPGPVPRADVRLVASGMAKGDALIAQLAAAGMPGEFADMGFRAVADLWPPWCFVMAAGAPVSVAFTARLAPSAAEVGVATPARHRGQGYAVAAVAGWARLPDLAERTLFYSHVEQNAPSRRVAEKLGLTPFACEMSMS